MPKVYRFTTRAAMPYYVGVVVGENEEFWKAATAVLVKHAKEAVHKQNESKYFAHGLVELVAEFRDDKEGWHKATKLAEDLKEYLL